MKHLKPYYLILVIAVLFGINPAWAQGNLSKKAQKYFDEAAEHLNWDRFNEAEAALKKAVDDQPDYIQAWEKLGYLYIKTRRYEQAYQALRTVSTLSSVYSKEVYYHLANMALATLRIDSAGLFLEHYKNVGAINDKRKQEVAQLESNILFVKNAPKHVGQLNPLPLDSNINTPDNEYYPSLTADNEYLYFTRQHRNAQTKMSNEDIYYSKFIEGHWGTALGLSSINTVPFNEGAHSISADGRSLYFTQCEMPGGFGSCDIFRVKKEGNTWGKPQNLGAVINTSAKETQPCISADGLKLYFVSSRSGGMGQLDIWVSLLQPDGSWGTPQNLGPHINSTGIDERPFIHPDGQTMYFASDGRPGYGDADIFYSRMSEQGQWQKAENIGAPINTFSYEGGIFVTRDGSSAYFATDRYSKGGDLDIYSFPMPESAKPRLVTYVKGKVVDNNRQQPLNADIEVIDLESQHIIARVSTNKADGIFLITMPLGHNYAFIARKKGYLLKSLNYSLQNAQADSTYELVIALDSLKKDLSVVLNNIFFEVNSFQLKDASKTELGYVTQLLNENPTLQIEVSGHTDNTGTEAYNQQLSQQRAESVVAYLVKAGIDIKRLKAKGYGSSQPVAPNDSEVNKARNRRTEFKVIAQ
ncbi:MAG: OmpA family protein [Chitinophagales bacterium]|nr:OmpA family protein [Chitinophagales bacterium]